MQCHYCETEAAVAVEKNALKVGLCRTHLRERLQELADDDALAGIEDELDRRSLPAARGAHRRSSSVRASIPPWLLASSDASRRIRPRLEFHWPRRHRLPAQTARRRRRRRPVGL
ncbi:MAG: hypothetical protein BRD24_00855 [Halobacteriales archaeon SW_9_67_24]|nr:MAG: hypothetical protein BRD24_00855 [Halobacteriales archaeon SW_9_67_24]